MDIEKTADLKCISRLLVEKWKVDQIKMQITVSPNLPNGRTVDGTQGGDSYVFGSSALSQAND